MERIQVASVSGSMCFDARGRSYRIIGNGTIDNGDYVFAHGGCVYGYEQDGGGAIVLQPNDLGIPIETSATFGMIVSKSLKYKQLAKLPAYDGMAFVNDESHGFFLGQAKQTNLVSGEVAAALALSHGQLFDCCVADDGNFYTLDYIEGKYAIHHGASVAVNLQPILDGAALQIAGELLPVAEAESKASISMPPTLYSINLKKNVGVEVQDSILTAETPEPGTTHGELEIDRLEKLSLYGTLHLHPLFEQPESDIAGTYGGGITNGVINSDGSYELIAHGSATFNTWNYEPTICTYLGNDTAFAFWWWCQHIKTYSFNMVIKNGNLVSWDLTYESIEPIGEFNCASMNQPVVGYPDDSGPSAIDSKSYNPKIIYPLPDGYSANGSTGILHDPNGKSLGDIQKCSLPRHVVKLKDEEYLLLHPSGVLLLKEGKLSNIFADGNNALFNYRLAESPKTMKFKKAIAELHKN